MPLLFVAPANKGTRSRNTDEGHLGAGNFVKVITIITYLKQLENNSKQH